MATIFTTTAEHTVNRYHQLKKQKKIDYRSEFLSINHISKYEIIINHNAKDYKNHNYSGILKKCLTDIGGTYLIKRYHYDFSHDHDIWIIYDRNQKSDAFARQQYIINRFKKNYGKNEIFSCLFPRATAAEIERYYDIQREFKNKAYFRSNGDNLIIYAKNKETLAEIKLRI